jgi:hypothetical protein
VLLHGLNQARVRRLFAVAAGQGTKLDVLPVGWLRVPRNASLTAAAEWAQALDRLPFSDCDLNLGPNLGRDVLSRELKR